MSYFRQNIEEAEGYVPGFQPKTHEGVKLNTNENPYPPSPAVLQAIADVTPEQLRRYPDPMGEQFRTAAGRLHDLSADSILCGNGGDDLLTIAVRACCDELRPLAYPVPTYSLYPVLAQLQNCPVAEVPFEESFALPGELAQTGAALTTVCNPNAPTGSLVTTEALASLAEALEGILLVDEAYVDFAQSDCVELVRRFDNVVILRSMSKGYSLAGLRFGYMMASPKLICGFMKIKDSYNIDAVATAAATAALEDRAYFRDTVRRITAERSRLIAALRGLGFDVPDSQSNFVLARSTSLPAETIHVALAKRNILVRYFDLPGLEDKLRISVGTAGENDALLAALADILAEG